MSSGRRLVIVLALVAGTAGGCADGEVKENNAYVNAVNAAQGAFATTSASLLDEISATSGRAHQRQVLDRFYAAVDQLVERLRAIDPPARVRSLHARLTSAIVRFGSSLRAAGADVLSGKASRILDGQSKIAVATRAVSRAINTTVAAINVALKA